METIIYMPPNLFYGTSIAVNVLVHSKHKIDTQTQFIGVSSEDFFKKETNNNVMLPEHIDRIVEIFENKEEVHYIATSVDNRKIADNDYNLSVSSYVEAKDKLEVIDIVKLNDEIAKTVKKIDLLRVDIDKIIKELEDE